jgi:hypothetical protein
MAHTYVNTPTLSKVKIGDQVYFLKDAELRSVVETLESTVAALDPSSGGNTFGSAAFEDVAQNISENGTGLPTSAQVYDFVSDAISDISGGLHYQSGDREDQTNPQAGDIVIEGTKEYLYTGENWIELGDESLWVPSDRQIAGIDLADDITVEELKTALGLGQLAFLNSITVTAEGNVTFGNHTNTNVLTGIETAAVAPTFTEGTFTPASLSYSVSEAFAKSGVTVTAVTDSSSADYETLVFGNAATGTASVISNFSGGSKAADTFTPGSAATFTSDTAIKALGTATFTGTPVTVPVVAPTGE